MKKLFKLEILAILFAFAFSVVSCSSEDEIEDVIGTVEPTEDTATIQLTEGGAADDIFYALAEGDAGSTVDGRVIFTTNGGTQRRLYVTQTLPGGSSESEAFVVEGLTNKELKADGSIDLDGEAKDGFDFTFALNVPSDVTDGSIIYNFWSTTGKGDFTDPTNSFLIGVGTIEVQVGTGTVESSVRSFDGVTLLEAPLGDGSSETFMSLFNGEIYTIDEGSEVAALWDFGYYYGFSGLASFASANDYPSSIVDVVTVANANTATDDETITNADLKTCYFNLSTTFTSDDFDTITNASELDVITQSVSQSVNQLVAGDVVEFVNSSVKGLIRIVSINGTDGSDGYITFDIKVQPYSTLVTN